MLLGSLVEVWTGGRWGDLCKCGSLCGELAVFKCSCEGYEGLPGNRGSLAPEPSIGPRTPNKDPCIIKGVHIHIYIYINTYIYIIGVSGNLRPTWHLGPLLKVNP